MVVRPLQISGSVLMVLALICSNISPAGPDAAAVVDWTRNEGRINRGIFSTQGFMQVYVEQNPMVMDSFLLTNPAGTHTRLETWIHRMEPENDNDDPNVFNWDAMRPQEMIRFITNRDEFDAFVKSVGMEPLSLLCYNADWLKSDDEDKPIASHDEWVEFAAAVVESYNGNGETYEPRLRYVEVWNEPNMRDFYTGTMESYTDLFERSASRIHRNYPGVMVGGPAISHAWHTNPEEWMEAFLEGPAASADFISYHHYGPQGEPVSVLEEHLTKRVRRFREIPGKKNGRAMITEIDAWFNGWPKIQHLLERQFMFLDHSDYLLSVHHFSCMAYNESGNYTFGIVDKQGGTIDGTFQPYWLFRNLIGEQSYTLLPSQTGDIRLIASTDHRETGTLSTAVFHNTTTQAREQEVLLYFQPAKEDRVLAWNSLREDGYGIRQVERVAAGARRHAATLDLAPGEGLALTMFEPGKRHFAFRDMNNQVHPWIGASGKTEVIEYKGTMPLQAEILNTTFEDVSGVLKVGGLHDGWTAIVAEGNPTVSGLEFGERQSVTFELAANTIVPGGATAPYVYLDTGNVSLEEPDSFAHSVPLRIMQTEPFTLTVLPNPIYTTPGEETDIIVQFENLSDTPMSVSASLVRPEGSLDGPREIAAEAGKRVRQSYRFSTSEPLGQYIGTGKPLHAVLEFVVMGESFRRPVDIIVDNHTVRRDARPLDLSRHVNHDPTTFMTNREDFDQALMGSFSFPADSLPSNKTVLSRGIPFRFADMSEGNDNAILPQGQSIPLPPMLAEGIVLLGFGHDGSHAGTFTIEYADGTLQDHESRIPEWCTPPPSGFQVAFNAPHRHVPGGVSGPPCELFMWTLETDVSKRVKALKLPSMADAYLFAVTVLPAE